jgi:hypothetical protein
MVRGGRRTNSAAISSTPQFATRKALDRNPTSLSDSRLRPVLPATLLFPNHHHRLRLTRSETPVSVSIPPARNARARARRRPLAVRSQDGQCVVVAVWLKAAESSFVAYTYPAFLSGGAAPAAHLIHSRYVRPAPWLGRCGWRCLSGGWSPHTTPVAQYLLFVLVSGELGWVGEFGWRG